MSKARFASYFRVFKLLDHQVVAVLVACFITYLMVPVFMSQVDLRKARRVKSMEAVEKEISVGQSLNDVLTEIEIFSKKALHLRPTAIPDHQKTADVMAAGKYEKFNSIAWWWPDQFEMDLGILQILPGRKMAVIHDSLSAYKTNLKASSVLLDSAWQRLLRNKYQPDWKRDSLLLYRTRTELENLCRARQSMVVSISRVIND